MYGLGATIKKFFVGKSATQKKVTTPSKVSLSYFSLEKYGFSWNYLYPKDLLRAFRPIEIEYRKMSIGYQ